MIPLARCDVVNNAYYRNITLKDIIINNPKMSTGVIMGGGGVSSTDATSGSVDSNNELDTRPRIDGLVFDNVKVTFDDNFQKWLKFLFC